MKNREWLLISDLACNTLLLIFNISFVVTSITCRTPDPEK
jgi:hypothetical protein